MLSHFVFPALGLTSCHLQLLLNSLEHKEILDDANTTGAQEPNKKWLGADSMIAGYSRKSSQPLSRGATLITPILQMWKPDAESLSNLPEVS